MSPVPTRQTASEAMSDEALRLLAEEFWQALGHQQEWLERPQAVGDLVCRMRTQPGFIFDDAFWETFHGFALRICHVAYYGPERLEDEDHKRPYVGVFELRFALAQPILAALFQSGSFALHSGGLSNWKIDCDALSDADIETLALMIAEEVGDFGTVEGVPSGGLRLSRVLAVHVSEGPLLIVDDVLTTGESMEEQRADREAVGAVIFARGMCPSWVTPLFAFGSILAAREAVLVGTLKALLLYLDTVEEWDEGGEVWAGIKPPDRRVTVKRDDVVAVLADTSPAAEALLARGERQKRALEKLLLATSKYSYTEELDNAEKQARAALAPGCKTCGGKRKAFGTCEHNVHPHPCYLQGPCPDCAALAPGEEKDGDTD